MNQVTSSDAILAELLHEPSFEITKSIPKGLSKQIEAAVADFVKTSHLPKGIDPAGFYHQTIQSIAQSAVLGGAGDFWLGVHEGLVVVYVLAHLGNDLDGRLTYTISQAWVHRNYRGNQIVKAWWLQIKQRARDCFAKHMVIISSRNPRAYERFLGDGMAQYCTMLRQDL